VSDLQEASVLGACDNPHEVVEVSCSRFRDRVVVSRQDLLLSGWRRLVEPRLVDHEGFWVCEQHVGQFFAWEDLY
jgi:hypothetical protein